MEKERMEKERMEKESMAGVHNARKLELFVTEYFKESDIVLSFNRGSRKFNELVENSTVMKVLDFYCVAKREIFKKRLPRSTAKKELFNKAVLKSLFHLTILYLSGIESCLMEELVELAKDL